MGMFERNTKYKFFLRTNDRVFTGIVIGEDDTMIKILDKEGVERIFPKFEVANVFRFEEGVDVDGKTF